MRLGFLGYILGLQPTYYRLRYFTVSKKSHYSVMSNGIFVFGSPLGTITKIIMYSFRNP